MKNIRVQITIPFAEFPIFPLSRNPEILTHKTRRNETRRFSTRACALLTSFLCALDVVETRGFSLIHYLLTEITVWGFCCCSKVKKLSLNFIIAGRWMIFSNRNFTRLGMKLSLKKIKYVHP